MFTTVNSCPSCSTVVTFRSDKTNLIVCSQCGSRLQRLDDCTLKQRDALPAVEDTFTPILIGTTGVWNGKPFTVIGRVRCVCEDEIANNWSLHFDDGSLHTLVECGGLWTLHEKIATDPKLLFDKLRRLVIGSGTLVDSSGTTYILERKNEYLAFEVEGEVEVFESARRYAGVEIASLEGVRLEIIDTGTVSQCCRIHSQSFESYQFRHLRQLLENVGRQTFVCSQCNKTTGLRSYPFAQSFACPHCSAAISVRDKGIKFRQKLKACRETAIPLHKKGTIGDIDYEVVGFMVKEDSYGYSWREYVLFNPVHHYAWLSEYNGHWIFLQETASAPVIKNSRATALNYQDETFFLYNEYRYSILEAKGEFPGDVFNIADPQCREFISPPEMWVREMQKDGFTWYHGEHISRNALYKAFGSDISLPYQVGIGAVQPVKGTVNPRLLKWSVVATSILLFLIFIINNAFNKEQVVYSNAFDLADSAATRSTITPKFRLDKASSNVELRLEAPLINNWLEANITLVNADNGKEYSTELGVEYYAGYEDGESWSEGSNQNTALLTSIPQGNYFLEIIAVKPVGASIHTFGVEAKYDVPMWSNFWIFLAMLLIPSIGFFFYMRLREVARWKNSNFSPYSNSSNDE